MTELPWKVIPSHPHIQELADDDLAALMELGWRLLATLTKGNTGLANGSHRSE